jgi:membrane-bound serine protease (ClpP class)
VSVKPNPRRLALATALAAPAVLLLVGGPARRLFAAEPAPTVVEIDLDQMVNHVTAGYVKSGITYANQVQARAVILELNTPGGLETSMRWIIQAMLDSRVPVITYVAPSGTRAASAGFFILLAGDLAVMAPGTNTGAAHPVMLGAGELGKTMEAKIENDAAAYIRSIAGRRGRNVKLAEEGVRESKSYTEKEALEGHLIDAVVNTPQDILARFDGKTIKRLDDSTTTLHLASARIDPFPMSKRQRLLAWIADPNIAFILGALGLACLYIEFTHPGTVAPGVVGAIALILALYAFNLLPLNYAGVVLIVLAMALLALEVKLGSHGVLAAGGLVALVIGALVLVQSPWPEARIRLSTALAVALPLAVITSILLRVALAARRRKGIIGEAALIDSIGVARTDLEPEGKVLVHGELWEARAPQQKIARGTRVRVREVNGLTLVVEPLTGPR